MFKSGIFFVLMLVVFAACKTSTNPLDGQKLQIITSDPDTAMQVFGPFTFTLTVLAPSGYGASGAYIDFYDPIEKRALHEGPTPEDGTWMFTDTIPDTVRGSVFEFAFVAKVPGAINSDSLRLWIATKDIRQWDIDSIAANSWYDQYIGVEWARPVIDSGMDTLFVHTAGSSVAIILEPFPQKSSIISDLQGDVDTIWVHNAYASSKAIVWASANYYYDNELYPNSGANNGIHSALQFSTGQTVSGTSSGADIIIAQDPNNHNSGFTIISPSVSALSGFSGGRTTNFYHIVPYIDTGENIQESYYTNDLSTYVNGATPVYEIPLPDSSHYSTRFIAVTEDGHYAQVSIGPVSHDPSDNNIPYANVALSYQPVAGLPYAGRGRKR